MADDPTDERSVAERILDLQSQLAEGAVNQKRLELDLDLEKKKLEIEAQRQKDKDQLALDQARQTRELRQQAWTRFGLLVPLFVAVVAGMVTLSTNHSREIAEFNLQESEAQHAFELKAAELVMASESPTGTLNRARALAALFPNRLGRFAENFNPAHFSQPGAATQAAITERKHEFLMLIVEHPSERALIARSWQCLFPQDHWINSFVGRDGDDKSDGLNGVGPSNAGCVAS